jgi:uncharacterized protein YjbJ (UPF0337 family)
MLEAPPAGPVVAGPRRAWSVDVACMQRAQEQRVMNWDQVVGKWDDIKGQIRQEWADLTDDDLEQAAGRRERIVGRIQQRYGESKEAIEQKLDRLIQRL